jgi:hypothetical protein
MQHLSFSTVYPTVVYRLFAMMFKVCPEPGRDTFNRGTVSSFAVYDAPILHQTTKLDFHIFRETGLHKIGHIGLHGKLPR